MTTTRYGCFALLQHDNHQTVPDGARAPDPNGVEFQTWLRLPWAGGAKRLNQHALDAFTHALNAPLFEAHGQLIAQGGRFNAAFLRALTAICPSCSRVVPYSWKWR